MKFGDLVKIDSWLPFEGGKYVPSFGVYLRVVSGSSPSFPVCEILTPGGVKLIGVERVTFL